MAPSAKNDPEPPACFPACRNEELVEVLGSLGLVISIEDIAKPQAHVVQRIFATFLEALAGTTPYSLERPKHAALAQMEYRELYDDGLTWMMLFKETRAMMNAAIVPDFNLQDLTRPNPKRFKRQMSALVNFHRFREDRVREFDSLTAEAEELDQRRATLVAEVRDMSEAIEDHKYRREEEEPQARDLKEENAQLSDRLLQLKKEQGKLLSEVDVIKQEKADLLQKQTNLQYELQLAETECRKLRGRIITSPKKLKSNLENMANQLHSERLTLAETERRGREHQAKIDVLSNLEVEIGNCIKLLEDCELDIARVAKSTQQRDELRISIEARQHEKNEQDHKYSQLERQLKHANDRLDRVVRGLDEKRAAAKAKTEMLNAEYVRLSAEKKERMALVDTQNNESAELERQLEEITRAHEGHITKMMQERESLCKTAVVYMDALSRTLNLDASLQA